MTLKRIITWGSLAAAIYFLMSYHFIFFGKTHYSPAPIPRQSIYIDEPPHLVAKLP